MNRNQLYMFCCIPLRLCISLIPLYIPMKYNIIIATILLLPAFGFLFLYATNQRLYAYESSNGKTWWKEYRLFHGMLYLTSGLYMFRKSRLAFVPLLVDVLFSLVVYFVKDKIAL